MTVESTELESHLGEYLRQIRSTGETLTVCEHSEPIATLSPIVTKPTKSGSNLIDQLLAAPAKVPGFQPLTRDEIYERR
jgi:antitoxin (DNA-binding transcriptional repressor) of toxin-antitoxin stability system